MDGAPWIAPEVAIGKAWTAAAYRAPSAAQGEKMKELHAFRAAICAATHGRFTPQIGGLPITDDGGTVIGAMGASGGTGQQDEDVVRAAIGCSGRWDGRGMRRTPSRSSYDRARRGLRWCRGAAAPRE